MFDLKDFRQNILKMTQEDFAKMIGVRQDYVSRMEKTPEAIEFNVLVKIAQATGTSLDELVGYKKSLPEALQVNNTWEKSKFIKDTILEYIKTKSKQFSTNDKYEQVIVDLREMVESTIVKPTIAVVGMSDAGKSKLINSLLGEDKMPTAWTPTTSISVHVKHIDDRPDFMDDEAWIFRSGPEGFDIKKFSDETYCKKWKIAGGSSSILAEYGTRQGDKYSIEDASAAVVYLDSSILQICDIVDLPGFGTGDRKNDDLLARKSNQFADVIIYMSISNGFLRGTDIEFLKSTLNSLPVIENKENNLEPLSNLFIIASQAHTVNNGSKSDLDTILDAGASRLFHEVPEEIWENREEQSGYVHNIANLRKRFYTYTTDKPYLREEFETDFKRLLESLSSIINEGAKYSIKTFLKEKQTIIGREIEQFQGIIQKRENYRNLFDEIRKNEPLRINKNQKKRASVVEKIRKFHEETKREFENDFSSVISIDYIVDLIKEKKYKKKKDDMERLAGFLSSKLQGKLQIILKNKSKELNKIIDKYLDEFTIEITKFKSVKLKGIEIPFDAVKVFASGLAGLATFGGLAVWASTLGNLGAYILVAKGVSVLSALGISVAGGTAGAASAVAALGGPVTLGIALAVIVGLSVFAFVSGGWQKSVAKKIVKEYTKNDAYGQFLKEIDTFWNDTEKAFNVAADHLEEYWKLYVQELSNILSSYSINDIEKRILQANIMIDFLNNIPLEEPVAVKGGI